MLQDTAYAHPKESGFYDATPAGDDGETSSGGTDSS